MSLDTPLDKRIHRPPARFLARVLSRISAHPNHLSILSLVPAAMAALCWSSGSGRGAWWGLFWFYIWAVSDHLDGEVARLRDKTSSFGERLDDLCDFLASSLMLTGIYAGIAARIAFEKPVFCALLFFGGLVINVVFGIVVLRRKKETERKKAGPSTPGVFGGREPFYLMTILTIIAYNRGGIWLWVLLAVLIGGCYLSEPVQFAAFALGEGRSIE